jgi:hypothetical protein
MAHRHLFICGLHRSGTSILHRVLRAHPQISGFHNTGVPEDEGQHLQSIFPPARAFGGPGKFCFADEAHLTEKSSLVTEDNRKKLAAEWHHHWDLSKTVLIEKSPPNIIRSRFLQAMFPDSYFVFLVRHPIAVASATQKWSHTQLPELVQHWDLAHQTMLQDRKHLSHYLLIRYEDLVTSPLKWLKQIYALVDLPMQQPVEKISSGINDEYFRQWESYRKTHPKAYHAIKEIWDTPSLFGYSTDKPYISKFAE